MQCMEEPKQDGSVPPARQPLFGHMIVCNKWVIAASSNFGRKWLMYVNAVQLCKPSIATTRAINRFRIPSAAA